MLSHKWINLKNCVIMSIFLWQVLPDGIPLRLPMGYIIDLRRLTCLLIVIIWVTSKLIKRTPIYLFWNIPTKLLIVFIFLQFTSSLFCSSNAPLTVMLWGNSLISFFMIFFILSDQIENLDDCKKILTIIAFTSLILCLFTFYENIYGNPRDDYVRVAKSKMDIGRDRVHASFSDPIAFANYLCITFFIIIYKIYQSKTVMQRFFWGSSLLITGMGLLLTMTKGSIISTAIFLPLFTISFFKIGIKRAVLWVLLAVTLVVSLWFLAPKILDKDKFVRRFQEISYDSTALDYRTIPVKRFFPIITNNLLLITGYGVGSLHRYELFINSFGSDPMPELIYSSFPVYYAFAIESGLISLIIYLFITFFTLKYLTNTAFFKRDREKQFMAFSLAFAVINFSVAIVFGMHKDVLFIYFALLAIAQYVSNQKRTMFQI